MGRPVGSHFARCGHCRLYYAWGGIPVVRDAGCVRCGERLRTGGREGRDVPCFKTPVHFGYLFSEEDDLLLTYRAGIP